ncbi:MAG: glycosyltransferase family 2 protein [Patescibacteria group bacterium]
MVSIPNIIFYVLVFLSVYVQVFFLVTFLENRKKIITRNGKIKLAKYPSVTITVPCWNEEDTLEKTVLSLLNLNYPKDKIKIIIVDDGSTDNTWKIINSFASYPNIRVFRKENEGKYTALNLGLHNSDTDFFGCLDADSLVHPESLVRIMSYFEKDPNSMAVTPALLVYDPQSVIQKVQKAEYNMGIYLKKMLGFLGAIHVTPGPLTIFRRKVFDELGPYRHAHNTEDMEIAYRMQKNHYKIEQCNDAYVYTNTPLTIRKLYKQRLRWVYGFINNTIDYKDILLSRKYGNFSFFTLPAAIVSIIAAGYFFSKLVYNLGNILYSKIIQFQLVGYIAKTADFDLFFVNAQSLVFITIFLFVLVIFSIMVGKKITDNQSKISLDMFYFPIIYSILAPLWIIKAVYNTVLSRSPDWR